jgi:predicted ATPase/transcriptional regulator with XRE-family HTH domain
MRRTHPFGDLLSRLRARKHGLTQAKLADLTGYDPAVIARMAQGQKDLTGTQARERVLRIIRALDEADVLHGPDEANALLEAAGLPPLFAGDKAEAALLQRLELHRRANAPDTLNAPALPRHNLPAHLTSFIGREGEIAQIAQFLTGSSLTTGSRSRSDARLITLTGPGGVGKTRLAIEAAMALADEFPDGAWYVPLSALNDPSLVAQAILDAFEIAHVRAGDEPHLRALVDYLQKRRLVLVLDNCEHVIDACADLIAHLMSHCPQLRILATSREALQVPGELALRVPPLDVPRMALAGASNALDFDAVRLFVERAQAIQPDFELTTGNANAVVHVCDRLDGIPLALELAAALLQAMSVEEIAARMDNRFALLRNGYRAVTPRHQALSNAIDWSYALLTPQEQTLLARLSVFAGAWLVEAAEDICADTIPLPVGEGNCVPLGAIGAGVRRTDVLPVLRQLVNKSLVIVASNHGEATRYRLLKTIQEYAGDKLREKGEHLMVKDNHLEAMVHLAEEANAQLHTGQPQDQAAWARLIEHQDELRAALAHAEQSGNAEALLRLAAALQGFWVGRGLREEGTAWMQRALALGKNALARLRIALMFAWAWTYEGDDERLKQLAPEAEVCLADCRAAQDQTCVAQAQTVLGGAAAASGNIATARACYDEALCIFEAQGDKRAIWNVRHKIGNALKRQDRTAAKAWIKENIKRYSERDSGDNRYLSASLADLAWLMEDEDPRDPNVLDLWQQSVAGAEAAGDIGLQSEFLLMLGHAELAAGERAQAAEHFTQSLQIACDMESKVGIEAVVEAMRDVDAARAETILQANLLRKQQAGDTEGVALATYFLGLVQHAG